MKTLQEILGNELYNQIKPELDKHTDVSIIIDDKKEPKFVPIERLNTAISQKKMYESQNATLQTQLDSAKAQAQNAEALQAKLDEAQQTIADTNAKAQKALVDAEIKIVLSTSGARNSETVAKLLDRDKIKINEDGKVEGLEDQVQALKQSEAYLFNIKEPTDPKPQDPTGNPANGGSDPNKGGSDPNEPTPPSGGTGNIGAGAKGGKGTTETIGAMIAKRKLESMKSQNAGFFGGNN